MPRLPFDIQLQDKETSPTTVLQLILAEENGRKLWSESRFQPMPPGQRSGAANSATKDPQGDLIWSQNDWSGGALVPMWTPQKSNGYATGSMDARHEGMLVAGMPRNYGSDHGNDTDPISLIIPNPHFEAPSAKIKWTDDGVHTITFGSTDDYRSALFGDQSCKVVAAGTGNAFSFAAANPTVYQGKSITFSMYFKRTAGTGGIRVNIIDSAGTTSGTAVTASDWTVCTATRTIDASATSVTFRVDVTTASGTFYCDDGTVYSGTALTATRIVELDGSKYATFGRIVAKLRTGTTDTYVWDAVYIHASAEATDIEVYMDNVYVAFGAGVAYIYGSGTSWTAASGGTGNGNYGRKFGVSRNVLWKAETNNTVAWSTTNPATGGSWSGTYTVGGDDANRTITRLYAQNDRLIVGKGDGLWYYLLNYEDGTSANTFINITEEYTTFTSTDHFKQGARFVGDLYMTVAGPGLFRLVDRTLVNMIPAVSRPAVGMDGKVRAVASDTTQLWCFVGDRLLSLAPDGRGGLTPYTHIGPSISTEVTGIQPGTALSSTKSPSANANRDSSGNPAWSNGGNAYASDDTYATATVTGSWTSTDHLQLTGFSFSIPTTATINGVEVLLEGKSTANPTNVWYKYQVNLLKSGTASGATKEAGTITTSDATYTLGSSTDLWGTTLSPTDVNSSTFGCEVAFHIPSGSETASVDHVQIKVYYTEASTATDGIPPRTATTTWWSISSAQHPVLLCVSEGLDSGSIPYAITDCWVLPHKRITDVLDPSTDTPELLTTSYIELSAVDLGFPNEDKVFNYLIIRFEDVDATQTTKVQFGLDGQPPTSVLLGTMNSSELSQTLYFDDLDDPLTNAVGKSIQFRLTSTYTGSSNKKRIKAIELHSRLTDIPIKEWDVTFYLGPVMLNTGQMNPESKAIQKSRLDTLESQKYPIRLVEDFDEDGVTTTHACYIVPGTLQRVEDSQYAVVNKLATYRMKLREQKVS